MTILRICVRISLIGVNVWRCGVLFRAIFRVFKTLFKIIWAIIWRLFIAISGTIIGAILFMIFLNWISGTLTF